MWYLRISPTFVHIHAKRHEIEPHIRATNAHVQRTHQSNNAREEKKIYKIYVEYNFEMFGWHMRRCLSIHRALTAQNIISRRCERKEEVRDEIEKKKTAGIKRNYRQSEQQQQQNLQKQSQNGHRVSREREKWRRPEICRSRFWIGSNYTRIDSVLHFWHKHFK